MPAENHTHCTDMRDKIEHIAKESRETSGDLETHIKVNEVLLGNINANMNELLAEVKAQRSNIGDGLMAQQQHIESKISQCYTDMTKILKNDYITKSEALHLRDQAILEQKAQRKLEQEEMELRVLAKIDEKVSFASKIVVGVVGFGGIIITVALWIVKNVSNGS